MQFELSIIKYPSGRFGFAGSVPLELAFEGSDLSTEFVERQMMLPASYRTLRNRVFDTYEEAEQALEIYKEKETV